MKKIFSLLFVLSQFSGCATQAKFEKNMKSWVGHTLIELEKKMGYPTKILDAANGNKVYHYHLSGNNINVDYGNGIGETMRNYCDTYFEYGEDKIILNWRYSGTNCTAK